MWTPRLQDLLSSPHFVSSQVFSEHEGTLRNAHRSLYLSIIYLDLSLSPSLSSSSPSIHARMHAYIHTPLTSTTFTTSKFSRHMIYQSHPYQFYHSRELSPYGYLYGVGGFPNPVNSMLKTVASIWRTAKLCLRVCLQSSPSKGSHSSRVWELMKSWIRWIIDMSMTMSWTTVPQTPRNGKTFLRPGSEKLQSLRFKYGYWEQLTFNWDYQPQILPPEGLHLKPLP